MQEDLSKGGQPGMDVRINRLWHMHLQIFCLPLACKPANIQRIVLHDEPLPLAWVRPASMPAATMRKRLSRSYNQHLMLHESPATHLALPETGGESLLARFSCCVHGYRPLHELQ